MTPTQTLAILYDLTLAIGGELRVGPLLTRTLQQLLKHTELSVGLALELVGDEVRLARAVGARRLEALEGTAVDVPASWVRGEAQLLRRAQGLPPARLFEGADFALRLPVEGLGALVLLGPADYTTTLPIDELFKPVLRNLARAVVLCRANEAHTSELEQQRRAERHRADEQRAEMERAQALSHTGSWTLDLATGKVLASTEGSRILGVTARVHLDFRELTQAIHPDDREAVAKRWARMLDGDAYDLEHRLVIKGDTRWIRSRVEVERAADGSPFRAHGVVQDITERRHQDQQLRKLSLAVDQSPEAILITDTDGVIEYVNDTFCRQAGFEREQVVGSNVREGGLPPEVFRDLWETVTNGEVWRGEYVTTRRDGSRMIEQGVVSPLRSPDGEITHFVAIRKDVTRTRSLEAELARHRDHLEQLVQQRTDQLAAIFRALPDLYFRVGRDGTVLESQAGEGAPASAKQALGRPLADVLPPSAREPLAWALERIAAEEPRVEIEFEGRDADATRTFEARLVPIGTAEVAVVVRDISEFHRIRKALAVARDAAEDASRAKSDFLANMSHEIRTPMNAILGFAHLLNGELLSPRQKDQLAKISSASRHLLSIINDILDFSKIEAGKLVLEHTEFDFGLVVAGVCDLVCERAREKGLELVLDVGDVPERCIGDSTRLQQVLLNFCSNAVKFTEDGSVLVRGKVLRREAEAVRVRLEVTDTGIGVSPEELDRLFRPFEQADASTTRRYGGTGLGLAIAGRLTQLMGGEIGCKSERGKGSTFWLEVPLGLPRTQEPPAPLPEVVRGARVLVVEDLELAREVEVRLLEGLGCEVHAFTAGAAALEAAAAAVRQGAPYRLALVDATLPGEYEGEAARRLVQARSVERVVLMGGEEPPHWRGDGLAAFAQKPLTRQGLLAALSDLSDNVPGRPAPAEVSSAMREVVERSQRGTPRVLVAEDNELNREVVSALFQSAGLSPDFAVNGREALSLLDTHEYDLVLMDMHMPELNGLDATRAIRARPGGATLPIVALTANAFGEDRDACLAAGMNDFLAKPVDPDALWRAMLRWWPSAPHGPPSRASTGPAAPATAGPAGLEERLARVRGLDLGRARVSMGGDVALLERLLQRFITVHRTDAGLLRSQWQAGEHRVAERVAHTLKGLAGTLGMLQVQQLAAEVEMAAHQGRPFVDVAASLDALGESLDEVADGIRAALDVAPGPAPSSAPRALDFPALAEELAQLARLLSEDDIEANTLHRSLKAPLSQLLGPRAASLARAIEMIDFPGALEVLRAAIAEDPRLQVPQA